MGADLILKFIFKFWPYILGILVIVGAWMHYQKVVHDRDKYKEQVVQIKEQMAVCEANRKDLEDKINKVNKAIDVMNAVTNRNTVQLQKLQQDVQSKTGDIKAGVDKILAGQKPKSCEDSIKYLIDAVKEYK